MRCPSAKRLAAASLGADPKALLHADTCERCERELAAMADLGAFARRAPVRVPSEERRARIAALVMATSDAAGRPAKSRVPLVALAGLAAAVALLAWRVQTTPTEYAVVLPVLPVLPAARASAVAEVAPAKAPVATARAEAIAPPAPLASEPAPPRTPRTAAPPATRVFAGSTDQRDDQLARDQITLAPVAVEDSPLVAFQTGWAALREARYAEAITAFDRATDPAVAEDAAYWAAIASARAGKHADAARRLRSFLATFPGTARRAEASALLGRLAP